MTHFDPDALRSSYSASFAASGHLDRATPLKPHQEDKTLITGGEGFFDSTESHVAFAKKPLPPRIPPAGVIARLETHYDGHMQSTNQASFGVQRGAPAKPIRPKGDNLAYLQAGGTAFDTTANKSFQRWPLERRAPHRPQSSHALHQRQPYKTGHSSYSSDFFANAAHTQRVQPIRAKDNYPINSCEDRDFSTEAASHFLDQGHTKACTGQVALEHQKHMSRDFNRVGKHLMYKKQAHGWAPTSRAMSRQAATMTRQPRKAAVATPA